MIIIISECNKLVQKENKTRPDWVRKVIHWELSKKLKFDHTTKRYMHKPESFLDNETHRIHRYFEIQKNRLISKRRPDQMVFVAHPTKRAKTTQGLLWSGSRRRAVAQTHPAFPKCLWPHRHSPKRGRLRCQAINLALLRRDRSCGGGSAS